MRSYLDVIIDVQDGKDVDKEELRVALLFCRDMLFFAEKELRELVDAVIDEKRTLKMQAGFIKENSNSRFIARKQELEKWWGKRGIPQLIK